MFDFLMLYVFLKTSLSKHNTWWHFLSMKRKLELILFQKETHCE